MILRRTESLKMQNARISAGFQVQRWAILDSIPPTQEIAVTSRDDLELWQAEQVAAESGGAESGAVDADNVVLSVPDDRRLLRLIDVWPMLTDDSRDAIARLIAKTASD